MPRILLNFKVFLQVEGSVRVLFIKAQGKSRTLLIRWLLNSTTNLDCTDALVIP